MNSLETVARRHASSVRIDISRLLTTDTGRKRQTDLAKDIGITSDLAEKKQKNQLRQILVISL